MMLGGGTRLYKLTDLFTTDGLNRAMKLFVECKKQKKTSMEDALGKLLSQPYAASMNMPGTMPVLRHWLIP
jgi:hypothetical protein